MLRSKPVYWIIPPGVLVDLKYRLKMENKKPALQDVTAIAAHLDLESDQVRESIKALYQAVLNFETKLGISQDLRVRPIVRQYLNKVAQGDL